MDENARLVGFRDCATRFAAEDGAVRMPTELVAPLGGGTMFCLFVEKLALLETCQHFYSA